MFQGWEKSLKKYSLLAEFYRPTTDVELSKKHSAFGFLGSSQ